MIVQTRPQNVLTREYAPVSRLMMCNRTYDIPGEEPHGRRTSCRALRPARTRCYLASHLYDGMSDIAIGLMNIRSSQCSVRRASDVEEVNLCPLMEVSLRLSHGDVNPSKRRCQRSPNHPCPSRL